MGAAVCLSPAAPLAIMCSINASRRGGSAGAMLNSRMAQNIYDQSEFFEGYSGLARSVHGLDGAPEWRAMMLLVKAAR